MEARGKPEEASSRRRPSALGSDEPGRLAGADALKYDELFPVTSSWPSKEQSSYRPHDNWDQFCRAQRTGFLQINEELAADENLGERLRSAETASDEITAAISKCQLEKRVAQDFMSKSERAAAKAGSNSCFCFNQANAEAKREAAQADLNVAQSLRDVVEKEEMAEAAKLEQPQKLVVELQERQKFVAAREAEQLAILDTLCTDLPDAAEQVAEDQVARLMQKAAQIEAALAAQKEVLRLLQTALVHFEGGQTRLKTGGGNGEASNAVQLRLHQAGALLSSSSSAIQSALSKAPFAPGNARLKKEPQGALATFLGTDFQSTLQGSNGSAAATKLSGLLESAYDEVLALYQWHEKLVKIIVEDLESNAASLVVGKRALLEERLRLVRQVSVQRQVNIFEKRRSSRISDSGFERTTLDSYANGSEESFD